MEISLYLPQSIYEIGQRDNQEDSIYPEAGSASVQSRIFLVCDGMGGHSKGEVASRIVCQQMGQYLQARLTDALPIDDETIRQALQSAYLQLDKEDDGSPYKMGTTLTLLCLHSKGCTVAHIGDSRIYHFRPQQKEIRYKSRDHSLVYDMFVAGAMPFEEMATSPMKNQITRAIQPGEDNRVEPDIVHIGNIQKGDYFFLCSDGMLETMTDKQLIELICSDMSDEEKQLALIEKTQNHADNHSAYLIHVEDVASDSDDSDIPDDEATSPHNALRYETRSIETSDVSIVSSPESVSVKKNSSKEPKKRTNRFPLLYVLLFVAALLAGVLFVFHGKNQSHKPKKTTPGYYYDEPRQTKKPAARPVIATPAINDKSTSGAVKVIPASQESTPKKSGTKTSVKQTKTQEALPSAESTPAATSSTTNTSSSASPTPPSEPNTQEPTIKTERRQP